MQPTTKLSRWVPVLGAGALAIAAGVVHAAGELRVLNWQGYGTDEEWAVQIFEERTGFKVVHDNFNSEQEMLTKLRTSPGAYDVVLINSAFTCNAAGEGLIQPIDASRIDNFDDLSSNMRDSPMLNCGGEVHGVAWVWGVTSFAYNTEKIAPRPDSIEILWDPAVSGRVGWRDDSVEAVSFAAIALGQDPNDPSDLDAVREKPLALNTRGPRRTSGTSTSRAISSTSPPTGAAPRRAATAFGLPVEFVIPIRAPRMPRTPMPRTRSSTSW